LSYYSNELSLSGYKWKAFSTRYGVRCWPRPCKIWPRLPFI